MGNQLTPNTIIGKPIAPEEQAEVLDGILDEYFGRATLAERDIAILTVDSTMIDEEPQEIMGANIRDCQEKHPQGDWAIMTSVHMTNIGNAFRDVMVCQTIRHSFLAGLIPLSISKIAVMPGRGQWLGGLERLSEAGIPILDDFAVVFVTERYDPASVGLEWQFT